MSGTPEVRFYTTIWQKPVGRVPRSQARPESRLVELLHLFGDFALSMQNPSYSASFFQYGAFTKCEDPRRSRFNAKYIPLCIRDIGMPYATVI